MTTTQNEHDYNVFCCDGQIDLTESYVYNKDRKDISDMFLLLKCSSIRPGKHYKEDLTLFNQRLYDVERRILLIIDKLAVCCDDRDKLFRIVENLSKSE